MTRVLPEEQGPTFEPTVHWCPRHLEPFRITWPVGWGAAMMALFEVCVRRDDIMRACGWTGEEGTGDTRMLDRVLREYAPLCCLVGDETTAKWTRLALGPMDDFKAALEQLRADN